MIKKILYFWFYFFFKISLLPFKILIKIFDNFKFNRYLRSINFYLNSNVKEVILNTFNNTNVVTNLERKKILNYVDIGSAYGLIPEVSKNKDYFNKIILFDGNEKEKSKLEKKGYTYSGATFRNAILIDAILKGANLKGAILERADLGGAILEGAILEGANFNGADLRGTNLPFNLMDATFKGAIPGTVNRIKLFMKL